MNDLIKSFESHLIFPFGTPIVISTAWETDTDYFTEAVSILDCLDNTVQLSLHYQSFSKAATNGILPISSLEDAIKYGYDMAYKSIPAKLWNYAYKHNKIFNWPSPNKIKITLKESIDRELVLLTTLLRKDNIAFEWLEKNNKARVLNSLIEVTKKLKIESIKSYPETDTI